MLYTILLTCSTTYLSVSKVIKDGGQFLGVDILTLGDNGRVWISPVYREPMKPHLSLLHVRLPQTGIKAVDLTSCPRERTLQGPIVHTQPATHIAQGKQPEPQYFLGTSLKIMYKSVDNCTESWY